MDYTVGALLNRMSLPNSEFPFRLVMHVGITTTFTSSDPAGVLTERLHDAASKTSEELYAQHIDEYDGYFSSCEFRLGDSPAKPRNDEFPAPVFPEKDAGDTLAVTELLFHYGRYLLISSSRANSPLPAHLQGVWNDNVAARIGWTCDMHLDINTQMNYWAAASTGLDACLDPLRRWIAEKLVPNGRVTAKNAYGLSGWK